MSMDMARLERAWAGAANRADTAAGLYLIDSAVAEVARRRLGFGLRMGLTGAVLGAWSLIASYGIWGRGNVDPAREWGAILMLAISWGLYTLVVRRGWEGGTQAPPASLPGSLRALLGQVEAAMWRIRIMALVVPLFLAAMGLAVMQLGDVGKMSAGNIRDFALLALVGFSLAGTIMAVRYHRFLKPEAGRLRRLLEQYGDEL